MWSAERQASLTPRPAYAVAAIQATPRIKLPQRATHFFHLLEALAATSKSVPGTELADASIFYVCKKFLWRRDVGASHPELSGEQALACLVVHRAG
jgi:hypothetical protein